MWLVIGRTFRAFVFFARMLVCFFRMAQYLPVVVFIY